MKQFLQIFLIISYALLAGCATDPISDEQWQEYSKSRHQIDGFQNQNAAPQVVVVQPPAAAAPVINNYLTSPPSQYRESLVPIYQEPYIYGQYRNPRRSRALDWPE